MLLPSTARQAQGLGATLNPVQSGREAFHGAATQLGQSTQLQEHINAARQETQLPQQMAQLQRTAQVLSTADAGREQLASNFALAAKAGVSQGLLQSNPQAFAASRQLAAQMQASGVTPEQATSFLLATTGMSI